MTRRQRRSLTPELKIEASRQMRTCLYGEFQDSEDFEVGFVDVTDELDHYINEFHELIAVSPEDPSRIRIFEQACR